MTKHAAFLLLAVLALPARAAGPEAISLGAETAFLEALAPAQARFHRRHEPVLQPALKPKPFTPSNRLGKQVARILLAAQLDKQRALMARQLGAKPWDIGVAGDAGFKKYYFTFTPATKLEPVTLAPLGDPNRLRGEGVDARVDETTVYNFKVSINIFNPVRGSTLTLKPVQGTRGPAHDMKTGTLLDAVKARSSVFNAGGNEYWLHYGTDVKDDGTGFADTRSFLIIHEAGTSSKAWTLAESTLKPDSASIVDLGGTKVALTRTSGGELLVSEAK